jgi:hypothetical protein
MSVHDWTWITAGTFDDFHNVWITQLRRHMRDSNVLPRGF